MFPISCCLENVFPITYTSLQAFEAKYLNTCLTAKTAQKPAARAPSRRPWIWKIGMERRMETRSDGSSGSTAHNVVALGELIETPSFLYAYGCANTPGEAEDRFDSLLGGRAPPPPPGQCRPRILFCSKGEAERLHEEKRRMESCIRISLSEYIDPDQSQ